MERRRAIELVTKGLTGLAIAACTPYTASKDAQRTRIEREVIVKDSLLIINVGDEELRYYIDKENINPPTLLDSLVTKYSNYVGEGYKLEETDTKGPIRISFGFTNPHVGKTRVDSGHFEFTPKHLEQKFIVEEAPASPLLAILTVFTLDSQGVVSRKFALESLPTFKGKNAVEMKLRGVWEIIGEKATKIKPGASDGGPVIISFAKYGVVGPVGFLIEEHPVDYIVQPK